MSKPNSAAEAISDYLRGLSASRGCPALAVNSTVLLSGSAGWGILEGRDANADWDVHVILTPADHADFLDRSQSLATVDDNAHRPPIFIQVRSEEWLADRLHGKVPGSWPLYLWIYTRGHFVQDVLNVRGLVESRREHFKESLARLLKGAFVEFSVRRLDTSSAAQRGLSLATRVSVAEMCKAALQTYSLLRGEPYPYNKWLAKHVASLDSEGASLCDLCEKCLACDSLDGMSQHAKRIRDVLVEAVRKKVGDAAWIDRWWEHHDN